VCVKDRHIEVMKGAFDSFFSGRVFPKIQVFVKIAFRSMRMEKVKRVM